MASLVDCRTLLEYVDLFRTLEDASDFEERVLQSHPAFLPPFVIAAMNGADETPEYYQWLSFHLWLAIEQRGEFR